MPSETLNLQVVVILTLGFTFASILGYLALRVKLSPILGYLLAGYIIGPFSPGYVADLKISEQLAEVGVMLMMFGVGLHFKWQDLMRVKNIAIPGAIGQTLVTAIVAALVMHYIGGSWASGVILGLAIGVASTVVLVRVLDDQNILHTEEGHIAVGWLIVEDVLTVAVLILLPTIVAFLSGAKISYQEISLSMIILILKFLLLTVFMFTLGKKVVSYALFKIAQTRSPELFILSVLALIFLIATGSAVIFGTSIALGAFIAGMVIGQTEVSHQASAYASPLKDSFVVIFFLSVGMLFNPAAIIEHFPFFISVLLIILLVKPLTAFTIAICLRYPVVTAMSIAIALAQIGEFSFILAEEASKYSLFEDESYDVIVACALISIAINPLLFNLFNYVKPGLKNANSLSNNQTTLSDSASNIPIGLVIGFGKVGEKVVQILEKRGFRPIVIDYNVDVIAKLLSEKKEAIYGEASYPSMLELAHIKSARILVVTILDFKSILNIITYARKLNPNIKIIARVSSSEEQKVLNENGITLCCCDDEEISHVFQRILSHIPLGEKQLKQSKKKIK